MPDDIQFSIVIIARSVNDYIRAGMPFIQAQTCRSFEIVIVSENPSSEQFDNARVIVSGRANPARARNIGAGAARGAIVAFLDDDAYPDPHWLENARRDFDDPRVGAVGGPSFVPPQATFFQRVSGKVFELSSPKTGPRYGRGAKAEVDDWPTCNFFVRKDVFERVGGFDDRFWGGEDTRFCYALVGAGVKIIYDPAVVVYHHPRRTVRQHMRQTYFWGLWRGFMMKRYSQSLQAVFFIPPAFVAWLVLGGLAAVCWPAARMLYAASVLVYAAYLALLAVRSRSVSLALPVAGLTALSHLAYGFGFWRGLLSLSAPTRATLHPGTPAPSANL